MENEWEVLAVLAAENVVHNFIKKSFRREIGSSVIHIYDLGTDRLIQKKKVFLPSTFPQSSGKSRATNVANKQRRT